MIVLDTSAVLAFMDSADVHHEAVVSWMADEREELVTTPLAVAEMDYLVLRHGGADAARALRENLADGAWAVEWWPAAMRRTVEVAEQWSDAAVGLADASLVALAERIRTTSVATLDERQFRLFSTASGQTFRLLPADL